MRKSDRFIARAQAVLRQLGAVPHPSYGHRFMTVAGPLDVSVHDGWVATRFEDVAKAKTMFGTVGEGAINPYSGKWNHHFYDSELKHPDACAAKLFKLLAGVLPDHEGHASIQNASKDLYDPRRPCSAALRYVCRNGAEEVAHTAVFALDVPPRMFEVRALLHSMQMGEVGVNFIPEQVGLPSLREEGHQPVFHEVTALEWTQTEERTDERTFDEFVDACIGVALSPRGWVGEDAHAYATREAERMRRPSC